MLAKNTKMDWQIWIITELKKIIIVTVPQNCTTAQLYDNLKKHPFAPIADQYLLTSNEGELEYSHKKRLSDYDIENKGNLHLAVKVKGGAWPSVVDLEARPRLLKASEGMEVTTSEEHPDAFGLDDDTPRAIMACGHAVAPLSLALHCYYQLEKGEESIKCPDGDCNTRWKFSQIRNAACLSTDESDEFERKALLNRMRKKQEDTKSCPECSTFCTRSNNRDKRIVCSNCTTRSGKVYEFCWICLKQWKGSGIEKCGNSDCGDTKSLFHILATCALKELNGVKCPSKRACPKCYTVIEHAEKCKHMTCVRCKYEFCFICLKPFPCETDVWEACVVAPRQTTVKKCGTPEIKPQIWQLFIFYDERRFTIQVPANCFVEEFFRTLYNHPSAPKVCGYRVICGPVQLENKEGKRLSEYGVQDHSSFQLIIRLTGG